MTAEQNQEIKIAVLEAKVDHLIGHVKELTLRVRANEKVVASISLLGVIACTFIGAGYFAPKAEACSPRLDGEPTYCPPWDEVLVKEPEGITEESFDEEFPDAFTHTVTLYDTRDDDPFDIAHMGHSFPTDQWIEKLRDPSPPVEEEEEPRYIKDWNTRTVTFIDTREDKPFVIMDTYNHLINKLRNWKSEKERTPAEDSINNALANLEWNYGSDDPTEQEELLQLPSNGD